MKKSSLYIHFEKSLTLILWNKIRKELLIKSQKEQDYLIKNYKPKTLGISNPEKAQEDHEEEALSELYYSDDNIFEICLVTQNTKIESIEVIFKKNTVLSDLFKLIRKIHEKRYIERIELPPFILYAFLEFNYLKNSSRLEFDDFDDDCIGLYEFEPEDFIFLRIFFLGVLKNLINIISRNINKKHLTKEIPSYMDFSIKLDIKVKQITPQSYKEEKFVDLISGFWSLTDDISSEIDDIISSEFDFEVTRKIYQLKTKNVGYEYTFNFIGKKKK
jgi:hypothetical protein